MRLLTLCLAAALAAATPPPPTDAFCPICPATSGVWFDCVGTHRNTQSDCEANPSCTWCLTPMGDSGRLSTPECRAGCTCDDVASTSSYYFGALQTECASGSPPTEWPPVSTGVYGAKADTTNAAAVYGASGGLATCNCTDPPEVQEPPSNETCTVCPENVDCPGRNTAAQCALNSACTWCLDPTEESGRIGPGSYQCRVGCTCDDVEHTSAYYFGALLVECQNKTVTEWPPVSSGLYMSKADTTSVSGTHYLYGQPGGLETCLCNSTEEGGGDKDPHLRLAYGGKADFRGRHGALYSFLSSRDAQLNVKTEDAQFMLKELTVHGSFFTEVHLVLRTLAGTLFRASFDVDRLGHTGRAADMVNGTCGADKPFALRPNTDTECDEVSAAVDYSTLKVISSGWRFTVSAQPVYDRLAGAHHRLDINMELLGNDEVAAKPHGLVGQTFDGSRVPRYGRTDQYPPPEMAVEFTTTAMAEGAIEGAAKDYEVADKYATHFAFSRFAA